MHDQRVLSDFNTAVAIVTLEPIEQLSVNVPLDMAVVEVVCGSERLFDGCFGDVAFVETLVKPCDEIRLADGDA